MNHSSLKPAVCLLEFVAGSVLTDAPPAVWGPSLLVATLWPSVWPCLTPCVWSCDHLCGFQIYALELVDMHWIEVMMMCEAHPCCNSGTICVKFSFGNFETKSSSINQFLLVTTQWQSPTRFWMDLRDYEFYGVLLWVNKACALFDVKEIVGPE